MGSAGRTSTPAAKSGTRSQRRPSLQPQIYSLCLAQKSYRVAHLTALHFVDLREVILEVPDAEKECHHAAQTQSDRLGGIEVFLDRVAHVECAHDPYDQA